MLPVISGIHKVVIFMESIEIQFSSLEKDSTVVIENILGEHKTEFIMTCALRISLEPSWYGFIA